MKLTIFILILSSAAAWITPAHFASKGSALFARQPIIAGNWKLNPSTIGEATGLALGFTSLLDEGTCSAFDESDCTEVVCFPPFPFISDTAPILEEAGASVGAQSVFFQDSGAFTGAVSASMVKSLGCNYVLCGHSERRTVFLDNDDKINRKVMKVIETGMIPMLCIGETKDEYDMGCCEEVCALQLAKDLRGVPEADAATIVIAYEPVWAIGTGLVCASSDAQKVHVFIRKFLASMYSQETADKIRIMYGGSVTPDSVDELMRQEDIDGCLVGGASLVAEKFARICNFKQ